MQSLDYISQQETTRNARQLVEDVYYILNQDLEDAVYNREDEWERTISGRPRHDKPGHGPKCGGPNSQSRVHVLNYMVKWLLGVDLLSTPNYVAWKRGRTYLATG